MDFSWEVFKKDRVLPLKTFIFIGVLSMGVGVYFFFEESYFAMVLFTIIPAVIILSSIQGPSVIQARVTEKGIRLNNKNYSYTQLKSFFVIHNRLVLKDGNNKTTYVPINPEEKEEVENALSNYIPQKEHEEGFVDIVNRFLHLH